VARPAGDVFDDIEQLAAAAPLPGYVGDRPMSWLIGAWLRISLGGPMPLNYEHAPPEMQDAFFELVKAEIDRRCPAERIT
jgi:hypothetical protein